jgi:hypothetical protein
VQIDFRSSERSSLGVEVELEIVDLETRELRSGASEVLPLLGRNHPPGGSMELALFRICPDSLDVKRYVVLDPDELEPGESEPPEPDDIGLLDAVQVWCEDTLDALPPAELPPVAAELLGIRDLELVADDCWPQVLALLSRPPLRDALTVPLRVRMPDGSTATARPYAAWWLRGAPVLDGRRPAGLRAAGGDPLLAGLYEAAEVGSAAGEEIDEQVLRALGVRTSAAALLDEPGGAAELLGRLADPELEVTAAQLHGLYSLLADLDPEEVTLPEELRAVTGGGTLLPICAWTDARRPTSSKAS